MSRSAKRFEISHTPTMLGWFSGEKRQQPIPLAFLLAMKKAQGCVKVNLSARYMAIT